MALHNWIKKKGNVKSRELRHDKKHSPHIPIFERPKAGKMPRPSAWGQAGAFPIEQNSL